MVCKNVLNPEELSKELGAGLNLIYRQLRSGKIPHVRCGDKYLISRNALEKWLAGESQNKPGSP